MMKKLLALGFMVAMMTPLASGQISPPALPPFEECPAEDGLSLRQSYALNGTRLTYKCEYETDLSGIVGVMATGTPFFSNEDIQGCETGEIIYTFCARAKSSFAFYTAFHANCGSPIPAGKWCLQWFSSGTGSSTRWGGDLSHYGSAVAHGGALYTCPWSGSILAGGSCTRTAVPHVALHDNTVGSFGCHTSYSDVEMNPDVGTTQLVIRTKYVDSEAETCYYSL